MRGRRHVVAGFQRILRRNQQPDLVEPQAAQRLRRDVTVAVMCGIEGAAKQPDAPAGPAPEAGSGDDNRAQRAFGARADAALGCSMAAAAHPGGGPSAGQPRGGAAIYLQVILNCNNLRAMTGESSSRIGAIGNEDARREAGEAVIDVADLLRGQRGIALRHRGELYRLRITSKDKLILTK